MLAAAEAPGELTEPFVHSAVSTVYDGHVTFKAGCLPYDDITPAVVASIARSIPGSELIACPAVPPSSVVPGTWLSITALGRDNPDVLVALSPTVRPTSRSLPPLLAALFDPATAISSALPVPQRGEGLRSMFAGILSDLAPVLVAGFGPAGIPPVFVAAHRSAMASTMSAPLVENRPSLPTALLCNANRAGTEFLPLPVACSARAAPSLHVIMFGHMRFLSRYSVAGMVLLFAWLAALPCGIAATALVDDGAARMVAFAASFAAAVFRAILAFTWTWTGRGAGSAILSLFFAPLRDIVAMIAATGAVLGSGSAHGEARFTVRRGGVLSPVSGAKT
jgi:hypothetical protein